MIAAAAVALLLMAPEVANSANCPNWQALAKEAEVQGFYDTPTENVATAFRRAAEAAECSNEPAEVSDRLWRRFAGWLSIEHSGKALATIDQRLQLIRAEQGLGHPREAPYLWLEARILGHERRDLERAEQALKRALEIMREAHGDASAEVADSYRRLAYLYSDTDRKEIALRSIDLAVASAERAGPSGRGALFEALSTKYSILDALKIQPDEREKIAQRKNALWDELQAEGWKPPGENY